MDCDCQCVVLTCAWVVWIPDVDFWILDAWLVRTNDVAEHFACFVYKGDHLQDDGSINIKELRNIFYTQYQPIYHYNNVGIGIVGLLLRCKLLHRIKKRQTEDGVVKFNMEMVRAASSTVTCKNNVKSFEQKQNCFEFRNVTSAQSKQRLTVSITVIVTSYWNALSSKRLHLCMHFVLGYN
uniref:Uncharacterized protein n=1 Tax=Timema shepardi TaxID=629360 RepID=A0A7R9AT66_TIMSH|nr:unnamed protein product [Timema shepardi]